MDSSQLQNLQSRLEKIQQRMDILQNQLSLVVNEIATCVSHPIPQPKEPTAQTRDPILIQCPECGIKYHSWRSVERHYETHVMLRGESVNTFLQSKSTPRSEARRIRDKVRRQLDEGLLRIGLPTVPRRPDTFRSRSPDPENGSFGLENSPAKRSLPSPTDDSAMNRPAKRRATTVATLNSDPSTTDAPLPPDTSYLSAFETEDTFDSDAVRPAWSNQHTLDFPSENMLAIPLDGMYQF